MLAHESIIPPHNSHSSRSAWFSVSLGAVKVLRCLGVFIAHDLLKKIHVVQLLFFLKFGAGLVFWGIQKPFEQKEKISKRVWTKIIQLGVFHTFIQVLWFFGITLCGPLRSILVFEQSTIVTVAALSTIASGCRAGPSKVRGTVLLIVGFFSLTLLDKDMTLDHADSHNHQGGLSHLFVHLVGWFGVADHKGGVFLLILALLLQAGYENAFKKISVEVNGTKRLNAIVTVISALILFPCMVVASIARESDVDSWFHLLISSVLALLFLFVLDYYGESVCHGHIQDSFLNRWCPILSFVAAFALGHMWFEPYRTVSAVDLIHGHGMQTMEHGLSGGVIVTLIFFSLASYVLTMPEKVRRRGHWVGWTESGLPQYVLGEDFLQKTSQSIVGFARNTLKQILREQDSRRIFFFLCINLCFCFVEFAYGFLTNSLGLISDGFHMLFDCTALVMGLVASVMTKWKPTRFFSYGFGRVEVLSGFINALFLVVIAFFIFIEAIQRLYDPPHVHTDRLLVVSIAGLLVNLYGMYAFSHAHSHGGGGGHDHGGDSHGHGHSHGGGNANMQGVFLHVLADTLGSVFVIISAGLIQLFGWYWVDPLCSLILAALIFASTLPLLKGSAGVILQRTPEGLHEAFSDALEKVLRLDGVVAYSRPHLWELKSEDFVASIHVQVSNETNHQKIAQQVIQLLRSAGSTRISVQIEKELFFQNMASICPNYQVPQRVPRRPVQQTLFVRAV